MFEDAFADRALLDGELAEFFFATLHDDPEYRNATIKVFKSFEMRFVTELADIHRRLDVAVKLVWGDLDPFFPVDRARSMVSDFPDANIDVIEGASLFSHEKAPAEIAEALLPTLAAAVPPN